MEAARSVVERFAIEGSRVGWSLVERLAGEAEDRALEGRAPIILVPEDLEGPGRLAALRLERRYPYVVLLKVRSDGLVRATIASLTRGDAPEIGEAMGGGGRMLWLTRSVGGFSARPPWRG